jgi:hypothetical protein
MLDVSTCKHSKDGDPCCREVPFIIIIIVVVVVVVIGAASYALLLCDEVPRRMVAKFDVNVRFPANPIS